MAATPGKDINWLEDITLLVEDGVPAVFDRYSNSFLKIYFDIPEGREDELARKVLIKHLQSGNSYGIVLKDAAREVPAARARVVGRGVADGRGGLEGRPCSRAGSRRCTSGRPLMAVTLTQLSAFLSVVRRGSVTAAAEELFVTQPSVSAAVAALERELGAKLLERDGRGLRPTAAGAAFAPYAAHVLGLLEEGGRAARECAEGARATLRISAVTSAGDHVVPPLIRAFCDRHPGARHRPAHRQPLRGLRGAARAPRGRRHHRPRAGRRPAPRRGLRRQRDRARHRARRPARQAPLGGGGGAGRAAVAPARAGLGLARDGRGVAAHRAGSCPRS